MGHATRRAAFAALAALVAGAMAACGGAAPEAAPTQTAEPPAAAETSEPSPAPETPTPEPAEPAEAAAGDFCEHMAAGLDLWTAFAERVFAGSGDLAAATERTAAELPARLEAAAASAPAEIADDVEQSRQMYLSLFEALGRVDTSDAGAVLDTIITHFDALEESTVAAFDRVEAYLASDCDGDGASSDAGAPPDPCGFVDAQAVADAAGLGVQLDEGRPASSFSVPGLSTEQCAFDGGAATLTIETIHAADPAAARQMYADNAERVIEAADLGSLPGSTLLTDSFGLRAIYVFDAPAPFGLQFFPGGDLDDADLVRAAEAVLAQLD